MENSGKRPRDTEPEKIESNDLVSIITEINDMTGTQKDKQRIVRKKYPNFVEGYPILFEMATKDDFDMNRFLYMIRMRDMIDNNTMSQNDASAKVGMMLYDKYVKDKISDKK